MTRRRIVALLLPSIITTLVNPNVRAQSRNCESHIDWVADVLKRINTLKVGSTRNDFLKLFTPEGGLSGEQRGTFVSRDCPYFKIDVEWASNGQPHENDKQGIAKGSETVIAKMTRPYLDFSSLD